MGVMLRSPERIELLEKFQNKIKNGRSSLKNESAIQFITQILEKFIKNCDNHHRFYYCLNYFYLFISRKCIW